MKWSLTESIYLYYSWDGETVYIANPEAKKFYGTVKRMSGSIDAPETVKNENLKITFKESRAYLDTTKGTLKIGNLNTSELLSQLSGLTMTSGVSEGVCFGFSPVYPSEVIVVFPGTELYAASEKEFIRKVNLTLYSKTTKYKEGHKYDSDKGTFWYLGEVISHKSDSRNSKRYTTADKGVRVLHAFITSPQGYTKVKDIFTNFKIMGTEDLSTELEEGAIYLTSKNTSMVDLGKELEPIDCKIEETWGDRLQIFTQTSQEPESYGSDRFYLSGVASLIDAFEITTDLIPQTQGYKDALLKILGIEFGHVLFKVYGTEFGRYGSNIKTNDSLENQGKSLVRNFFEKSLSSSQNYYFYDYYTELFKVLFDIDVLEVAKNCIESYKLQTISLMDYSDLIRNFAFLEYREPEKWDLGVDFVCCNEKKRSFSNFIKPGEYQKTIREMYDEALQSNGSNLEFFNIENVGTDRRPELQYTFKITLPDILNHYGVSDLNELPELLKEDMTKNQIYRVTIRMRDGLNLID